MQRDRNNFIYVWRRVAMIVDTVCLRKFKFIETDLFWWSKKHQKDGLFLIEKGHLFESSRGE